MSKNANVAFIVEAIQNKGILLNAKTGELELQTSVIEKMTPVKNGVKAKPARTYLTTEGIDDMAFSVKQKKLISEIVEQMVASGSFKNKKAVTALIEGDNVLSGQRLKFILDDEKDASNLEIVVRENFELDDDDESEEDVLDSMGEDALGAEDELDDLDLEGDDVNDELAEGEIRVIVQAPNPDEVVVDVEAADGSAAEDVDIEDIADAEEDEDLDLDLEGDGISEEEEVATETKRKKRKITMKVETRRRRALRTRRDQTTQAAVRESIYRQAKATRSRTALTESVEAGEMDKLKEMWKNFGK